MIVGTKNDSTVNGIELGSAKFCFVRFWVIQRLLQVVSELAKVSLLALLFKLALYGLAKCGVVCK